MGLPEKLSKYVYYIFSWVTNCYTASILDNCKINRSNITWDYFQFICPILESHK